MKAVGALSQKKLSRNEIKQADIRAKVAGKFGKNVLPKTKEDKVEISVKAHKHPEPGDDNFTDIKDNNPNKEETRVKLQRLLKMGGFQFSEKERAALSEILN